MQNMHTYLVLLTRVVPKAGARPNFRVELKAPDDQTAKRTAEEESPGYKANGGASLLPGNGLKTFVK